MTQEPDRPVYARDLNWPPGSTQYEPLPENKDEPRKAQDPNEKPEQLWLAGFTFPRS